MKLRSFWAAASSWARHDIWNVGIATLDRPIETIDDLRRLPDIRWLPPQPPLYFLADPFPYHHNGRDWLLVEQYGHPKGVRGRICRVDPFATSTAVAPEPVIARSSHISYPFTFVDGDAVYCAPEISQEDGCVIYRLDEDGAWTPRHHILRGRRIVDPTFFPFDGRWWLFFTDAPPFHNLVLHGYYAEAIAGPWTPHPGNPLKSDLSSARPAGRPFTLGGRLFRPAQDCRRSYGGALNVMEILELTPTAFRETRALRLRPDPRWPYPDGFHHLVVDGTRVYIDAKRTRYDCLLWLNVWLASARRRRR